MNQASERPGHSAIAELRNPLMNGLACAALSPGLRSLLVFDASPHTLQTMAGLLAQMVTVVTEGKITTPETTGTETSHRILPVQLSAVETEEDLWGSLTLGQEAAARKVVWREGLLAAGRNQEIRIVVIPDLSRLSLAASRACVMLMGSEVAHLERHGQHDRWQPQLYWLASCDHDRIGMLSPHLLDRFALRLSGGESQDSLQRAIQLQTWWRQLKQKPSTDWTRAETPELSVEIASYLQQVKDAQPDILPEARERVLDYSHITNGSTRRNLALLRLARVNAQLEGTAQVTRSAVSSAAKMIGLSLNQTEILGNNFEESASDLSRDGTQPDSQNVESSGQSRDETMTSDADQDSVFESDTKQTLASTTLPKGGPTVNPYLEDTVEPERAAASLRLPPRRFQSASLEKGAIIGIEPATEPQNLAIVGTLLEAAKYQQLRWQALRKQNPSPKWAHSLLEKQGKNGHTPLILHSGDLQRYRRAAVPEQLLTLVLDYTCLKECQWQEALLPYLQWAYVERASVCLVQVGALDAQDELRAEKREADNILVPRIRHRLEANRGRATPLAHGLDLALQTLRHGLQHGRNTTQKAVLVVISDGRGNVPLEASRIGKVTPPVGKRGIDDALAVAHQIAALKSVEVVVLNPQPKYYTDLPVKLAQALGAKIAKIPTLKAWEVNH